MYNDYNRYTFMPANFYRNPSDDSSTLFIYYYDPEPSLFKKYYSEFKFINRLATYNAVPGCYINRKQEKLDDLIIYDKLVTIKEIEDIKNAYKDQYGKELDIIIKKEDDDMTPVE